MRVVFFPIALLAVLTCGCESEPAQRSGQDSQAPGADSATISEMGAADSGPRDQQVVDGAADQGRADQASADLGQPDSPVASCSGSGLAPGTQTVSLQYDGLERSYRLHVPTGYDHSHPVPLVLIFHGLGGSPSQIATSTGMDGDSDANGFIAAYPQGVESSWNAGICCGEAASSGIDDVGFVRAVVADLEQKLCIDSQRVYATGMSNGGFLSNRLGCEAADVIAAIAPVCGSLGITTCSPSRPVPVIAFNGTDDPGVNYNNLALPTFEGWAQRDGCTDAVPATTYSQGDVHCETYSQCQAGVEVTLCSVEGGGHCWPGRPTCLLGNPTTDISANQAMWEMFQRFSL